MDDVNATNFLRLKVMRYKLDMKVIYMLLRRIEMFLIHLNLTEVMNFPIYCISWFPGSGLVFV